MKNFVYFILASHEDIPFSFVKIGMSRNKESLKSRLSSISTNCPMACILLCVIPHSTEEDMIFQEKYIHGLFLEHRAKGEWYYFTNEVRDFIKTSDNCVKMKSFMYKEDIDKELKSAKRRLLYLRKKLNDYE